MQNESRLYEHKLCQTTLFISKFCTVHDILALAEFLCEIYCKGKQVFFFLSFQSNGNAMTMSRNLTDDLPAKQRIFIFRVRFRGRLQLIHTCNTFVS